MYLFFFFIITITAGLSMPLPVHAEDTLLFDSTDHYLGGCQVTDTATWTIDKDMDVTTFQIWYSWNSGESSLPVKLTKDDKVVAEFTATRASCDPYQKQWCNADFSLNQNLSKGTYETTIPNKRMCLKPGGTGTIRLYGASKIISPTGTLSPQPTATPTSIPATPTTVITFTESTRTNACECNQTTVIATAAGTAMATACIVSILMRKKV